MLGASGSKLRAATISAGQADIDAASEHFHQTQPTRSAKRVLFWTQAFALAAIVWGVATLWTANADVAAALLRSLAYLIFVVIIFWRLIAAAILQPKLSRIAEPVCGEWPIYTILCPLYREGAVAADLVAALERLDYPATHLDIKLLIEGDDLDTLTFALAAAAGKPHFEVLVVPAGEPRTKPKALNVGLARARGAFVAVYDAEDRPHPLQLRAALAAFEDRAELACVQAPLVIDNAEAAWIARQFAVEYAIQFREILPLLARMGLPLPLGGSSNHFRRDVLIASGAWDAYNVTEDADLGYRLARDGWKSDMITPPTWEEAPVTLDAWRKQRTRWIKGHAKTWLVLMRNPFKSAREMGLSGFLSMHLVLGGGVAAAALHGPICVLMLAALFSPANVLGVTGFALALSGYCVGLFSALSACAVTGDLRHLRAALTMPLYWPLASIAALCAFFDLLVRPHAWAKTMHGVSARTRFALAASPRFVQIDAEPARLHA